MNILRSSIFRKRLAIWGVAFGLALLGLLLWYFLPLNGGDEMNPNAPTTGLESSQPQKTDQSQLARDDSRDPVDAEDAAGFPGTVPIVDERAVSARRTLQAVESVPIRQDATRNEILREEVRGIRPYLTTFADEFSQGTIKELEFPLFDGRFVVLVGLQHQATGELAGVLTGRVMDEAGGGHVVLSYRRAAMAGTIHRPERNEYYEIRTGPDGVSSVLTQLDPEKIPPCGVCAEHHHHPTQP